MSRSFPSLNIMFGSDRNSSFVKQDLVMLYFYVFQKTNLRNSSVIWNKINSSSDLLISYLSKMGEFMAENQVLERNYNRATIHHFHLTDYSESSLFYSALKNKLKETRHTFYCVFNFNRSHIITINAKIDFYFVFHSSFS